MDSHSLHVHTQDFSRGSLTRLPVFVQCLWGTVKIDTQGFFHSDLCKSSQPTSPAVEGIVLALHSGQLDKHGAGIFNPEPCLLCSPQGQIRGTLYNRSFKLVKRETKNRWLCWRRPVIPAPRTLRQRTVGPRLAWYIKIPYRKTTNRSK